MTKTPSALKWLAEKRARLTHDVQQTALMAAELEARLAKLQGQLQALDHTIQLYGEAIDPAAITAVNGWQGRYGKLGGLRDALIDILQAHGADWVASDNIEIGLIARFSIGFETSAQRKRWRENTLGPALRRLLNDGSAERRDDPDVKTGKHGYWRLKQAEATSLADL